MNDDVQQDTPPADADLNDPTPDEPGKLVPVTEAIRYRKRAQTAERELEEIKGRLQDLQDEAEQARETVTRLERRQQIDALLADTGAVDLEVARLLTEAAVEQMDDADVRLAIDDLRRAKPYLFRHATAASAAAMPAKQSDGPVRRAEEAAESARSSGDRRELLRYLRLRRSA